MAELPLDQAVPRFKENEDRLDTFVNSATGYTTSGGVSVQSIQQFLASIGTNGIDFVDNAKARFGTGNDLEIYHDSTNASSVIKENGTGSLVIQGTDVYIKTAQGENSIFADTNAGVTLYYNNSSKMATNSSGINVFGTVEFDGLSGTGAVTITDIADEDNMASNSATKLATQQSIKAYVDAQVGTADTLSEVLGLGNTTGGTNIAVSASDDITFGDGSKAIFGGGSDLEIFHNGTHSYIKDVGTGDLKIDATNLELRNSGGGEVYLSATANGSVAIYNNNAKKFETKSGGIDVFGNAKFSGAGIRRIDIANTSLADTGEIVSLSYDNSANFAIQGRNSASVLKAKWYQIQSTDTDARADAHVFYTDLNVERMSIDATGIDVTGNVAVSGTVDGRDVATDGTKLDGISTGADVTLDEISAGANVAISAAGVISATASGGITNVVDDTSPQLGGNLDLNSRNITGTGNIDIAGKLTLESSDPEIFLIDTNTNVTTSIDSNSSAGSLQIHVDKDETGSNPKFIVNVGSQDNVLRATTSGINVIGTATANDINITDTTPNLRFEDTDGNHLANFTQSGSHLYIDNDSTGNIRMRVDGNTEKLVVNSSGIDVTGTVEFDGLSGTGSVTVTDILDEDDMTSDSATALATQQSIKAYVDANAGGGGGGGLPTTGGTMTGDILFNDNVKAKYGTSSDLEIYHDTNNSWIRETGTGNLNIGGDNEVRIMGNSGSEFMGRFIANGNVNLYHNNNLKFQTLSTGIDVTGVMQSDTLNVSSGTTGWLATMVNPTASGNGLQIFAGDNSGDRILQLADKDGNEAMRVTGERKLGIGTTAPSAYLHIKDDTAANDDYDVQIESFRPNLVFEDISGSATDYQIFVDSNAMKFLYGDASTNTKLANEVLEIYTSGINVTGIVSIFDNNSDISPDSLGNGQLKIDGNGYRAAIALDADGVNLYSTSASRPLIFGVNETEVARVTTTGLDVTGNIFVNRSQTSGVADLLTLRDASAGVIYNFETYADPSFGTTNRLNYTGQYFAIRRSGTEQMRFTSSGIDVTGTLDVNGDIGIGRVAGAYTFREVVGGDERAGMHSDASNQLIFKTGAASERMKLTSSGAEVTGDILVKDASPVIALKDTTGDTTTSTPYVLYQSSNGTQLGYIGYGSSSNGQLNIVNSNSDDITFFTANTQRLAVQSTGIDVTGDLTVSSTIEVGSLTPAQDGAIEVGVIALGTPAISSTTDSTGLRNHIIFDNPNGAVGRINTLNSSTSYLTSSDYRLKTDVVEMTGSIDRLKALRPVNFEWVVDGTRVDGFLAHEAQEVIPEAVDGEKDAMRDQKYVESEATGDIYTPAVKATYETIQVELTPAIEAVYETVTVEISPAVDAVYETITVEISPAVEATYDDDGNELTPAVEAITEEQEQLLTPAIEAVTEEQEQLVTPAVDATYEEQEQELTPAIDEVIHSSDVVEPDELEEGQRWRETTEKVMATRQVPDYQGIDQSKIVPLLTSALQDAIAKIEALETRLEALEA